MGFLNGLPLEADGNFVSRFCIQLVIILVLPRILHATLLQHLLQPRVVSEIITGIILGPSCLGQISGFTDLFFPARSIPYLNALGQLGVFFYMFMTGCHLDIQKVMRVKWYALSSGFVGMALSFALAPGLALLFEGSRYSSFNYTQMIILIVIIQAISAASVLARILTERGLLTSNLGSICMSTATIDVFACFILLAALLALYGAENPYVPPKITCPGQVNITPFSSSTTMDPLWILLIFIGYVLVLLTFGRFLFTLLANRVARKGHMEGVVFVASITLLFASVWFCSTLTVSTILGGLCLGLFAVPRIGTFCQNIESAMGPITVGILLPVFFALIGLKTDWAHLTSDDVWRSFLLFGSLWPTTFLGAFISSVIFRGFSFEGLYFSILIICKGLTVLTILSICLNIGVITKTFYSLAVLYSIISCVLISPIVAFFQFIEYLYKRHLKPQSVVDDGIKRILCVPRTGYLAPIAATIAAWIAKSLANPGEILFARLVDDIENLDQFLPILHNHLDPAIIGADAILGPCSVRWNGLRPKGKVIFRGVIAPNLATAYLKLAAGTKSTQQHPFDYQIIGYEQTSDSAAVLTAALSISSTAKVFVVTGQPGCILAAANHILLIDSSNLAGSVTSILLQESAAKISNWNEESKPQDLEHFKTIEELLEYFSNEQEHSNYDAVFCLLPPSLKKALAVLDIAYLCHIPIIFEASAFHFDSQSSPSVYRLGASMRSLPDITPNLTQPLTPVRIVADSDSENESL